MANTIKELQYLSIPFEDVDLATEKFTTVIGKGGYGNVYRGKLFLSGKPTTVAVKRLNSNISDQGFKEFLTEIKLLSRYKHPNLISLLGFCEEGNEKILIYEYAVHGSLDKYLSSDGKATPPPLTWTQRINICIDAACGLDYLHNHVGKFHKIIHRDIKSANILLDRSWKAMISDLGLSKIGRSNENDSYLITNACGTHGYCDPVYRDTGILTKESDVYSFGVVLFEILCGRLCFMDVPNERRFLDRLAPCFYETGRLNEIIDIQLKDRIGSTSLNIIADIAYQCLQNDRGKRPSMGLVVKKLEEARESHIMSEVAKRIELLFRKLNSMNPDDQRTAAGEIRLLAKQNADNRVALAEAGAIPLLTHLLIAPDSRTQEHAVTALLNLSICEDNKGIIVSSGAAGIVQVLRAGSMDARENAAATLFSLSVIDENKVAIGSLGAIPPLMLLLNEGTRRGKKDAATALLNLCIYQGNKGRAVRAGVVPTLMGLLTEPESVMKDEALAILAMISSHPEGKLAIGQAEAVPFLVEFIGNGSLRNKENAATILVHLCSADQKYLVEAQEVGVMGALVDLLYHGTDRGKRKAGQLLEKINLESLLRKLNSVSPDDQRNAAGEIRLLAKWNAENRVALAEAGAIPLLTHLLNARDSHTQEHAITALLNLSINEDNKGSIVSSGAVPGIIQVLRTGSMEARENAAATLYSLTVTDENKVAIGNLGAIPPLVLLLNEGTERGKKDAVTALFNLCIYQGNKGRAVRADVVPTLMGLTEPESVMKEEALAILALISCHPEGKLAIGEAEAVPVLVEFIGNGSPRNKENAAAILVDLFSADQKYLVEAKEIGVIGLLEDLLHHGTRRGKRKARQLLGKMTGFV